MSHTPMIRQYLRIKAEYPNHFLFYRLGDFYELFYEDAIKGSELLGIRLTARGQSNGNPVPMAGIPFHSADSYKAKLLKHGASIAICEEEGGTGEGGDSSGLKKREVKAVITPGTVSAEALLEANQENLLIAVAKADSTFGIVILEVASGRFEALMSDSRKALVAELHRLKPAELLISHSLAEQLEVKQFNCCIQRQDEYHFDSNKAARLLTEHFQVSNLKALGCEHLPAIVKAAGCLLSYLQITQQTTLTHVQRLKLLSAENTVFLDAQTQHHLELTQNLQGTKDNTVAWILDKTATAMGSRLLIRWIKNPIRDIAKLEARQMAIKALLIDYPIDGQSYQPPLFLVCHRLLKQVGDIERILGRIGLRSARPRDLIQLRSALRVLPELKTQLQHVVLSSLVAEKIYNQLACPLELLRELEMALVEEPPLSIREGGVIAKGYHQELDTLRNFSTDADQYLKELENREKDRTGISKLKVNFNRVHGYYIEISRQHKEPLPTDYTRRQTLKNTERFITPELKHYESKALSARAKALMLEKKLYEALIERVAIDLVVLQNIAQACSLLDVLSCLAERAEHLHLKCPILSNEPGISIKKGRHFIIEQVSQHPFIANNVQLDLDRRMLLITGPNMGGKSTYMRQTALIVLLAMIGSFVPAESATIYPVDGIFTRIGSGDDLAGGRSTFMVEMNEMANILQHATNKSLVLIDEIGRGTSTYDGLSLAYACAEYLAKVTQSYTLFSTHYFELTHLDHIHNIANIHLAVATQGENLSFLYTVREGPSYRSYGIKVAKLAGLPLSVIQRAEEKLQELEKV